MRFARAAALVIAALAIGGLGYWIGKSRLSGPEPRSGEEKNLWTCSMHPQVLQDKPGACPICGMQLTPVRKEPAATAPSERKIRYWWDPMMQPPFISDKPGKSPMGMDLVPIYEDDVRAGPTVTIDPVMTQNIGIRVAKVEEGPLSIALRTVGYLREAEPRQHDITLKVDGWIEKLHANTEGMFVKKGDPLFDLYSPELLIAQEELLSAKRALDRLSAGADDRLKEETARLVDSGKQKLALWNVPASAVDRILKTGKATPNLTFRSPLNGFVTEKMVVQGSPVEARMKILRIVDQSELWIEARIYESQILYVKVGQKARAVIHGRPEEGFEGEVIFLTPRVDPMTRAIVARLAFPNPQFVLKPGMFATIEMSVKVHPRALLVPREAVIDSGVRQIAFVVLDHGRFEPRRVRMGLETGDGHVQILEGLAPGEPVVVSGQFLLDSESRLREAIEKLTGERLLHPPDKKLDVHPQTRSDPLIAPYLAMSRELAGDRPVADEKVDAFVEASRKLPGEAVEELRDAAGAMREKNIKEQREAFKKVSARMIGLLDRFAPTRSAAGKLYVVNCPMAEADWLQDSEEIANPYWGDEMLECGAVKKVIETVAP